VHGEGEVLIQILSGGKIIVEHRDNDLSYYVFINQKSFLKSLKESGNKE